MVEQRDPQAGLGRRRRAIASPIAFGSAYGVPSRVVMEVVELAHGRDPGQHHLGERGPRQAVVRVGIERSAARRYISRPARSRRSPGPACVGGHAARWKAWLWALASPGNVTPREPGRAGRRRNTRLERAVIVPSTTSTNTSRSTASAPSQRPLAEWNTAAAKSAPGPRSTKAVMRATDRTQWRRSNCSQVVRLWACRAHDRGTAHRRDGRARAGRCRRSGRA